MKKLKHDWNSLADYISVHEKTLRRNESYMTHPQKYVIERHTEFWWTLSAKNILFRTFKGTEVRVDIVKDIEIDPSNSRRPLARTESASYSANRPKATMPLIRYCYPHFDRDPSKAPDHHRFHHKHDFATGKDVITKLDIEEFPHVSEFLLEVLSVF